MRRRSKGTPLVDVDNGVAEQRRRITDAPLHNTPLYYVFVLMLVASSFSFAWLNPVTGFVAALCIGVCSGGSAIRRRITDAPLHNAPPHIITFLLFVLALRQCVMEVAFARCVGAGEYDKAQSLLWKSDGKEKAFLGAIYATAGEHARAEALLRESLAWHVNPLTFNNLGNVLAKQKRWKEAEEVYSRWAKCGINHGDALSNLSIVAEQQNDHKQAAWLMMRKMFLFHRETTPGEAFRTAALCMKTGDIEGATEIVRKASERGKVEKEWRWNAEWFNLAGAVALKQGDKEKARVNFEAALELNPSLESARRNLGMTR